MINWKAYEIGKEQHEARSEYDGLNWDEFEAVMMELVDSILVNDGCGTDSTEEAYFILCEFSTVEMANQYLNERTDLDAVA